MFVNNKIEFVNNFITKLIDDSNNQNISWNIMSPESITNYEPTFDGQNYHCNHIVDCEVIPSNIYDEYGRESYRYYFNSQSFGTELNFYGNSYNYELNEYMTIYLMSIVDSKTGNFAVELWIASENKKEFLCSSLEGEYNKNICALYQTLNFISTLPTIDDGFKEAIDDYMNGCYC